jgi:Alr-MurF fusion protein
MEDYLINKIAEIVNGNLYVKKPYYINQIFTDSRSVFSTSNGLFFAIKGERHNGHVYIEELIEKGIRNFVVSENYLNYEKHNDCNFILVRNTIEALQKLASYYRNQYKIPIIGITGSNGKTIVKDWLSQALDKNKIVVKSPKSYNSQIGVPLSVIQLNQTSQIGIFEAGISLTGEMNKIEKIIQPKFGIITNIGNAHQENFQSIKEKIREKLVLFKNCKTIIYCKDHKEIRQEINNDKSLSDIKHFTWAQIQDADLQISSIRKEKAFSNIEAVYKNEKIDIKIPFTDSASIENAIHVWATLLSLNYPNSFIKPQMSQLMPIAMRLELKEGINKCSIINDSYNSDFESLNIAVDYLMQQNQHTKHTLILSDILQSGLSSKNLYKKVHDLLEQKNISRLIGIGNDISKQKDLFKLNSLFYESTDDFIKNLDKINFQDEAILLKGARKFTFEKISEALQKKAHRTVLEINLDAITDNLNYFKRLLNPQTKIMVMVKAFSYGSGTFEIANLLEHNRVDYLGVAFADEGIALRKAGITIPIMVMNPEEQGMSTMINYKLEPEIYSFKNLEQFIEIASRKNIKDYPIHIKVDTGMHRLGFTLQEIPLLIEKIKDSNLNIKSVFSHLAGADEGKHDHFSHSQIEEFNKAKALFKNQFNSVLYHILNSAGIERFPNSQFDMVRLGIGLYGIGRNSNLKNISTLKTQISQIKIIAKDETVGYGRQGEIVKESKIATIPIGYADGFNRLLSNGNGRVFINNQYAPIVGNICMDMTMIDVTGIDVNEGDTVILFGHEIPVTELAKKAETIPYEIFTSISERVKRVYFHENI